MRSVDKLGPRSRGLQAADFLSRSCSEGIDRAQSTSFALFVAKFDSNTYCSKKKVFAFEIPNRENKAESDK